MSSTLTSVSVVLLDTLVAMAAMELTIPEFR
jgi:hypothetical protein